MRRLLAVAVAVAVVSTIAAVTLAVGIRNDNDSPLVASASSVAFPTRVSVNIDTVPWCLDEDGTSDVYPCKWDSRVRPAPLWDRGVPKIALFVRRATGCPIPVPSGVGCYWAPEDQ